MTNEERFYRLALNILNWPNKDVRVLGERIIKAIIDLNWDDTVVLSYWRDDNTITCKIENESGDTFHGYVAGPKDWPILDDIIRIVRQNEPRLLEGIE